MPSNKVLTDITNLTSKQSRSANKFDIDAGHLGDTEEHTSDSIRTQGVKSRKLYKTTYKYKENLMPDNTQITLTKDYIFDWLNTESIYTVLEFNKHHHIKNLPSPVTFNNPKHKKFSLIKLKLAHLKEHNELNKQQFADQPDQDDIKSLPCSIVDLSIIDQPETDPKLINEINSIEQLKDIKYPRDIKPGYMAEYEYYSSDTTDSSSCITDRSHSTTQSTTSTRSKERCSW